MKIFRGFDDLPCFENGVATLGSFDGVHCGHKALLAEVRRRAAAQGSESVVYTFEPHPRITLNCAEGLKLLNTAEEKAFLLSEAGVDNLVFIPFTEAFSRLSPEQFISEYVVRYGIGTLVVGYNHRFGRDKQGDYAYLSSSKHQGWPEVAEVGQQFVGNGKVSSTIIRKSVAEGDMDNALRMLGRPYIFAGDMNECGEAVSSDPEYKLLPPVGRYEAAIDGCRCTVRITESGRVKIEGANTGKDRVYINIGIKIC